MLRAFRCHEDGDVHVPAALPHAKQKFVERHRDVLDHGHPDGAQHNIGQFDVGARDGPVLGCPVERWLFDVRNTDLHA